MADAPASADVVPFPVSGDDYGSSDDSQSRLTIADMHGGPIPLGYDHDVHSYLSLTKNQIIDLTPSGHSEMNLRGMAPYEWYAANFKHKKTIDWKAAAECLMRWCEDGGVFDVDRIKGRGVHLDHGRVVIHLGNRLMMDGIEYAAGRSPVHGSELVYEAGRALRLELSKPLSDADALAYFQLVNRCSWGGSASAATGTKEQAILAAGWAVIAPICGILPSRPNLWVTGSSSAGKTWLLDNLLHPAIGPMLVKASLKTTEPGLRRYLRLDALPVAFNEAEARDIRGADVIQKIVELARASYDDQGAEIIMANGKGGSDIFKIRSIFAFLSIGASLRDTADSNRTVVVQMMPGMTVAEFSQFRVDVGQMVDGKFAGRLLARTFANIPTILENIHTLTEALVPVIGDRRIADTMAPLLAGYASLRSSKALSAAAAAKIVNDHTWISEHAIEARSEALPDHKRIVSRILETIVSTGSGERRSLGELIQFSSEPDNMTSRQVLMRHGIRVEIHDGQWEVWFARAHEELNKIFSDTPWSTTWSRIMRDQYKPELQERGKQRFGLELKYAMTLPLETIRG